MLTYEQIFEDRWKNIEENFRIYIEENKVRLMMHENMILLLNEKKLNEMATRLNEVIM
jgi:hypothetical protein